MTYAEMQMLELKCETITPMSKISPKPQYPFVAQVTKVAHSRSVLSQGFLSTGLTFNMRSPFDQHFSLFALDQATTLK